nr:hypothetical protein BaRGS_020274 [Batillaria attramentaria]
MESPEPSNLNTTSSKDASPQADDYDANGALQYIVATLCVYALVGILSLLLVRIVRRAKRRRRLYMRHEENQNVRLYVRNSNTIRLEGHRQ